jgi:3-methylcrotonyl-CoA carboxylase alpha subunit
VHPGYGFLSENAGFVRKLEEAKLTFIGPPASAITKMGSKAESKHIMGAAKVPIVPGYHGDKQDPKFLLEECKRIGFPVLLKASLGGGGKGMKLVRHEGEF